jgi:hypothetical protein
MKHVLTQGFSYKDVREQKIGKDVASRNDLSRGFFTYVMTINLDMFFYLREKMGCH